MKTINLVKSDIVNLHYLLRQYWKHGRNYMLIGFAIAIILTPAYYVLGVFLYMFIVDHIFAGSPWITLVAIVAIFQAAFLVINLAEHLYNVYGDAIRGRVLDMLNKSIFAKAVRTDSLNFDDPDFYDNYAWTIQNYSSTCSQAKDVYIKFFSNFVTIASMIAIISILDATLMIFVIISVALRVVANRFRVEIGYKQNNEMLGPLRILWYVQRIFVDPQKSADLKSNRSSDVLLKKYDESSSKAVKTVFKYAPRNMLCVGANSLNYISFNFLAIIYLAYRIINGDMSAGSFFALLQASLNLNNQVSDFFHVFNEIRGIGNNGIRIIDFMKKKSKIEEGLVNEKIGGKEKIGDGLISVELKNVKFRYSSDIQCLENINMKINKGDKIAIVGVNGAGKSTLVKLLLRLYDVDEGELLINEKPITDYDVHALRMKIGVAFQSSLIYAMKISEYMQLYNNGDEEQLKGALEQVGLTHILNHAANGLHNELTKEFAEDGIMLSGGEEQKLALSRLLIGQFGMLILDEPSSALDPISEYNLNRLVYELNESTTTIMISHRLSSVRYADKIYLLGNGTILENGSHDDLMRLNGKYAEMFNLQAKSYVSSTVDDKL